MIDITFGVLNYNPGNDPVAEEHYKNCVESLYLHKNSTLKSEVYLIDQGGPEKQSVLTESLARKFGFQSITLRNNIGISRGINLLAHVARGKFVSLVTSDTLFEHGLDDELLKCLDNNQDIYQVCPMSDISDIEYQKESYADNGITKCIAQELTIQFWPKTTFDKIGYFDERWKAQYENLDFALRAYIHGGYAAVSHDVRCRHYHNMTSKNGSIHHAYDGYLQADHNTLRSMWNQKWYYVDWNSLYNPAALNNNVYQNWRHFHESNIYLPYLQDVGY